MLAIGEFSTLTHLSVRTLRRYHDAGLLVPAAVDEATGYRSYAPEQIPTAQVIHRLRELDVPLPAVRRILASPDPTDRAALVAAHLRDLEAELARTRAAVASLRRLLEPTPPPLAVELRAVPATTVAAVEGEVAHDDLLAWYAGAMAELDAALRTGQDTDTNGHDTGHDTGPTAGPPGGAFDNALFEVGRGHALVHRPTTRPPRRGRVHTGPPAGRRAGRDRPRRAARRHRRHVRRARGVGGRQRARRRRAGARDLPGRPAGHRRSRGVAHRDRVARVPGRRVADAVRTTRAGRLGRTGMIARCPKATASTVTRAVTAPCWADGGCGRRARRDASPRARR